jgi:plasmid stability protein
MGQVIVRNLDDHVVARLKSRAARNGRSLEQELRNILTAEANETERFLERAAALRSELEGREFPDAVAMIREDRDR